MAADEVASGPCGLRAGSRGLLSHWESRRAGRHIPARGDIDARAILGLLPWTGVLASDVPQVFRWRTAGSGLIGLWGRNLIGRDLTEAWPEFDRHIIVRALTGATDRLQPFAAQLRIATGDRRTVEAELIALPIEARPGGQRQVLCGLFPIQQPDWVACGVPAHFEVTGFHPIDIEPGLEEFEPPAPQRRRGRTALRVIHARS